MAQDVKALVDAMAEQGVSWLGRSHTGVATRRRQAWSLRATARAPEVVEALQATGPTADRGTVEDVQSEGGSEPPNKGTKLAKRGSGGRADR
jgi:hypothetical protein